MKPGWRYLPGALFSLALLNAGLAAATTSLLDTDLLPEARTGTNESADPLTSPSSDATVIRIPAHLNAGGVALRATTVPGEVEIAQYGVPEDLGGFKSAGFQAVRFEPPFEPPFTITRVTFPSFTMNGVPALFPSIRLCEGDPVTGLPRVVTPLFALTPYSGSPNGVNEIPVDITVSDFGKTFWLCIEFPSKFIPQFPNDYPFIRMDARDMERGFFNNSFAFTAAGQYQDPGPPRNLIVSLFCRLASPDLVPIEASSNLGANRLESKVEFFFKQPEDRRADGVALPEHSLRRVELLYRVFLEPLKLWAWAGPGQETIPLDSLPNQRFVYWTTQAVDRYGHRATTSDVIVSSPLSEINPLSSWDREEPNGRLNEAATIAPPINARLESVFPAGDQDFYNLYARPGDVIFARAFQDPFPTAGTPHQDLVMLLFDKSGKAVAIDDSSSGRGFAQIVYTVPPRSSKSQSAAPLRFTLQVADIRGSRISPDSAPRAFLFPSYGLTVRLNPPGPATASARAPSDVDADRFVFRNLGPNPANPHARLLYILPQSATGEHVLMRLYDAQGRLVRTLLDRRGEPGAHVAIWDGRDDGGRNVASGTYYARLTAGTFQAEQKVSIVR